MSGSFGLLDRLAAKSGCMYLSDLKMRKNDMLIKHEIRKTDASDYSAAEWNDAINYLTGKKAAFSSPGEAKTYLLKYSG